ncbi:MAG: hypothetical protein HYV97_15230 [Bdellovibrio sp.]|nr:hypothetical protein [Bdellovibrio sp.]
MAKKRIAMAIQEEIARLRGHEHSQRKVAKILGINRNTVAQYWHFGPTETSLPHEPDWVKSLDWNYLEVELTRGALRKTLYKEIKDLPLSTSR